MRIQIIGAGLAGCSIAASLWDAGHEIGLYDENKQYSGWAICTGKVFRAKSDTNLAHRLNAAFDVYEEYKNASPIGIMGEAFKAYVRELYEIILYKHPKDKYKELKKELGDKVAMTTAGDIIFAGYQLNAAGIVTAIRNLFPEKVSNPELIIHTKGAWEREGNSPFKVVPVRGITAEITVSDLDWPSPVAFHWPAKGLYYVPNFNGNNRYLYGTVMIPDVSFNGSKLSDNKHIIGSDESYMMADWLREKYGAKVTMTGAIESISAGYRPWIKNFVPGVFKLVDNNLYINGLYQSGAQLFFWLGNKVAQVIHENNLEYIEDLNIPTKFEVEQLN